MRFPALQNRQFVIYTLGSVAAVNGIWINRVIVGWLGWELTGLASWVGLLSFFLFAPTIVSGPLFGVLLDRVDPRRASIISQSLLFTTLLLLLALQLSGLLNIWLLAMVALLIGFGASADRTIRFVLVPRIVGKEALANAVAIHGINFNTARLIGPAVGGFLLDWAGTDVAIIVNIAMIVPFIACVYYVRPRDRDAQNIKPQRFFTEMLDGARHALTHPVIREAMILTGLFSITVRGALELLPAIADGEFQRGAQGLGQMLAASGAGALLAAIRIAIRRSCTVEATVPLGAYVSVGVGVVAVILLGVTDNWWLALGLVFVLGYCLTTNGIDLQSSVQLALTDAFRGRVMSLWVVLVIGGAAVSAIALGSAADLFGMSAALIASGIACALALSMERLVWWRRRRAPPAT